jgi:hypothetical protein
MNHRPQARASTIRAARAAALAALSAGLLAGCGILNDPVPLRDDNSPVTSFRAAFYPRTLGTPDRSGPGVEFGVEGYRASDVRTLAANETLVVGGQVIPGPDSVRQRATLRYGYIAYTHRLVFGPNFEIEPFGGYGRFNARFTAEPSVSALRPVVDESRRGPVGGLTTRWRFNEWLALEGRLIVLDAFGEDSNGVELALALRPVNNLSLRLGYSDREHVLLDRFGSTRVEIRARGPSATLMLEF